MQSEGSRITWDWECPAHQCKMLTGATCRKRQSLILEYLSGKVGENSMHPFYDLRDPWLCVECRHWDGPPVLPAESEPAYESIGA